MRLLRVWDGGQLSGLPDDLFKDRVPIVLFQIMVQTLQAQESPGSWDHGSFEISAYAVLTLVYLCPLPWATCMRDRVEAAITSGRLFLCQALDTMIQPEHIWIEKVLYGSSVLCEAYILAAINAPMLDSPWGEAVLGLTDVAASPVERSLHFFTRLPLFTQAPRCELRASLTEGYLFLPQLKRRSREIFSRDGMAEDKYLEYIPLTWTTINNLKKSHLSAKLLQEMMVVSMLNYQVDEYMEAVVGKSYNDKLQPIKHIIRGLCGEPEELAKRSRNLAPKKSDFCDQVPTEENGSMSADKSSFLKTDVVDLGNGRACLERSITEEHNSANRIGVYDQSSASVNRTSVHEVGSEAEARPLPDTFDLESLKHRLGQFVKYVLCHPRVATASPGNRAVLRQELRIFLLAHVTHVEDNLKFSQQELPKSITVPFLSPNGTYYRWVHTTSADHTSCPYSFAFFVCLISNVGSDCFKGAKSKYLAQDLCAHLAVMCRQYNDYGSIARDRVESNLNSVNFPEFHATEAYSDGQLNESQLQRKEDELKSVLFEIAEYERESLDHASRRLKRFVPARIASMLDLFLGVTDLYGQIYVARDIAIRMN